MLKKPQCFQPGLLTTKVYQRGAQALLWVIFVIQLVLAWGILQSVIRELFSGVVPGRVPVEAWGAFFELWCVIFRHFVVHFVVHFGSLLGCVVYLVLA